MYRKPGYERKKIEDKYFDQTAQRHIDLYYSTRFFSTEAAYCCLDNNFTKKNCHIYTQVGSGRRSVQKNRNRTTRGAN